MSARRAGTNASNDPGAEAAEPRFEDALAKLETLVNRLESGELDLEQALGTFEEGVSLAKLCSVRLEAAELRIRKLEEGAAGLTERPLDLEDDE
jgi:exodeoxyribonuclease VII small subunit